MKNDVFLTNQISCKNKILKQLIDIYIIVTYKKRMAKVFISYRTSDIVKATKLAEEIKIAGHEIWFDVWEVKVGDSIIEKIQKGLIKAEYFILCLSITDVMSEWIKREWMSTLARQLYGEGIRLIPVRLTGGKPPPIIADIKLIDLVTNWDEGILELLKSIR